MRRILETVTAALGCFALLAFQAGAQSARIRDITMADGSMPVRLLGYGIVVGLDGTGDRGVGGQQGGQTVQSVANLLRRFDIEIPAEVLRTRNAAAVLVTAEVSPYLRPGGKFDITISSLGDARSLRGGTLWMTPLVTDAGAQAVATGQGSIVISDGNINSRDFNTVETSGRIPSGGLLEGSVTTASFANSSRLLLKEPDIGTATKIVAAINQAIGANTAKVEDPGSVELTLPATGDRATTIVKIQDLKVTPDRSNKLVIDGRDGTVVAGGDMTVGEAVVSHGGITLTIGGPAAAGPAVAAAPPSGPEPAGGVGNQAVRVATGASVQAVASALQAVQTSPSEIAAIFESLREVGALSAEVTIR
ncbi:MAG TPA: flagellar basal body P-ring protein FlgI [Gemmatimonadaceae bacterium]|nr:flagellar basal body P-ring protein FlgI [Gemmatimonadaceae bacterium]